MICMGLLLFLSLLPARAQSPQSTEKHRTCQIVCGATATRLASLENDVRWLQRDERKLSLNNWYVPGSVCSPENKLWTKKATSLMRHLGFEMRNTTCPFEFSRQSSKYSPGFFTSAIYWAGLSMTRSNRHEKFKIPSVVLPEKKSQYCEVSTIRGIRTINDTYLSSNNWFLMITAQNLVTNATISEFLDLSSSTPRSFMLFPGPGAKCNSTCEYTVMRHERQLFLFSLFVDWKNESVPGYASVQRNLEPKHDAVLKPAEHATWSKIAILCLPLLMTIPPISLLETVSYRVTLWYVFATDILAVVPVLIKGAKLIEPYQEGSSSEMIEVRSLHYAFFEMYNVGCFVTATELDSSPSLGIALVALGIWFMLASILAELVV